MAQRVLTDDDEGKPVVNADGERVGVISGVRDGRAYVDPDPSITDRLMARLGWEHIDGDDYPLGSNDVSRVTDDEVTLKRDLRR